MALDNSIPGSPIIDDWPTPLIPPARIRYCDGYRDGGPQGGTYFVEIEDSVGNVFPFFFDRFLGRLCYGKHDGTEDAAFIRKGSKLESEAFAVIEAAVHSPGFGQDETISPDYGRLVKRLAHARRWKDHRGDRASPEV